MILKDWLNLKVERGKYYRVVWKCNWHRARKPNKCMDFCLILRNRDYLEFEGRDARMSYKSIISIKRIKK